jgi:hypothetical protein
MNYHKYKKYKTKYMAEKKIKNNLSLEQKYLDSILNYFGIIVPVKLLVQYVPLSQIHPDIWVEKINNEFHIYVTHEWQRQPLFEKQKRIVHEVLHIMGENHWTKSIPIQSTTTNVSILYSTYPMEDTFSLLVWYELFQKGIK